MSTGKKTKATTTRRKVIAQATVGGFAQMVAMPTLVTMFLAGVWHGAGMQFLLYGLMHGFYITGNHAWRIFVPEQHWARRALVAPVAVALTFVSVLIGDVMFRAASVRDAATIYGGMSGRHGAGAPVEPLQVLIVVALLAVVWLMPNTQEILGEELKSDAGNWSVVPGLRWRPSFGWWAVATVALLVSITYSTAGTTFLYFQF